MLTITALTPPPESPAATSPSTSTPPLRVGLVQHRWHEDQDDLHAELSEGIASAAKLGASVVFLPELTLSRYPRLHPGRRQSRTRGGRPAHRTHFRLRHQGRRGEPGSRSRVVVRAQRRRGRPGFNTAILVSPGGELLGRTRKLHIPVTAGYYEDTYFRGGPSEDAYPVHEALGAKFGLPTCWDEWFPEVARAYSLAGAQVLVYPTAIGSEPDHPNFDTQPLWQQVIVGNGVANGTFMVVPNRHGSEGLITFYGSSFISDPYGRILVQAPRDESAVLVADLDLQHREDWLALFPFLATRDPTPTRP